MNSKNQEEKGEFKPITDWQRSLVKRILELNPHLIDLDKLLDQVDHAETRIFDEHGCFDIKITNAEQVSEPYQIAEIRYPDSDTPEKALEQFGDKLYLELKDKPGYGPHVSVMVFTKDGFLSMVEFNKEDASDILNKEPHPSLLLSTDLPSD